ncbi:MAG: beta-galactosidase [Clostridia bacterium]|nr:beta-galactosidase [Clostridia bacterium]
MKDILIKKFPHIIHGADYNPDQWQDYPQILKDDMRLMRLADMNEMTLGIFAWSAIEPVKGKFDFSFLDRAMDDVYAAGGRVILATPSGAKPVWLAKKYPEICRVDENGIKSEAGGRHNHCNNSPVYRQKVREINEKLAERYKNHPALIAWHISNEYGNSTDLNECFCENCKREFRVWLQNKYKTIENLNREWWTAFWSHKFSSFDEIDPPSFRTDRIIHARNLDWKRFNSDKYIEFLEAETEPLKRITPDTPVTTNLMELYPGIDYRKLAKSIDFVSWDSYPLWSGTENDIDVAMKTAFSHDFMRSLKHRPFLLMESTPSLVNWQAYNKLKRPGMHALSSLQAVAHGSDSVQYFQFRKSRGCSEKFHGAVVDHCSHENTRVFSAIKALGSRLKKLDGIVGTKPVCEAAVFHSIENMWAIDDAQGFSNKGKKYYETLFSFYKPLWESGINTDIIGKDDDFGNYKVIFAPMLYMVDENLKNKLCDYVNRGGTLVCTYMTGYVNENDLCYLGGFPAEELKDLFGIWNEEIDTLYPQDENRVATVSGQAYTAKDYCEIIHTSSAETLGVYESDFYKGSPAFTANNYGKGKAYYIAFRSNEFVLDIVKRLLKELKIKPVVEADLPAGVTAHSRTGGGKTYVFLENYNRSAVTLDIGGTYTDIEKGTVLKGKTEMEPVSLKVISLEP